MIMAENNSEEGHHTVTDSDGRTYQVQAIWAEVVVQDEVAGRIGAEALRSELVKSLSQALGRGVLKAGDLQVQATPGSGQTVHTCRTYILTNPMQIEYFVQLDRLMNERRIDADRHRIVKLLEEPGSLVDFDILIDRINAPHECDYGGAIASK